MATDTKRCTQCGAPIDGVARMCPSCTSPLGYACPTCRRAVDKSQRVCPGCARALWVHCSACAQWTFVQDTCEACGTGLMLRCPSERCGAYQFFENAFCTKCGQRFDRCLNEEAGLCVACAPRQNVMVSRAHADAAVRNSRDAEAQGWNGSIEQQTTICPSCGKRAGAGNFCNNCGASVRLDACPSCQAPQARGVSFCNNCGTSLSAPPAPAEWRAREWRACRGCGTRIPPETRFCGQCGTPVY